jgi:hypothetical protein
MGGLARTQGAVAGRSDRAATWRGRSGGEEALVTCLINDVGVLRHVGAKPVETPNATEQTCPWRWMRLWNELSTRRDPGHGVARSRTLDEMIVSARFLAIVAEASDILCAWVASSFWRMDELVHRRAGAPT